MAKNEIKHRISLEGDEDVKRRLKAVGEAGKASMQDIEKRLGAARSAADKGTSLGKFRHPAAALSDALSPAIGEFGGEGGGLFGSIGGLFTRLASGLKSGPGLIGVLTAARLKMAQLGDETKRSEARITALGGGSEGFAKLNDSAQQLGVSRGDLQPGYEDYLANFSRNSSAASDDRRPGTGRAGRL